MDSLLFCRAKDHAGRWRRGLGLGLWLTFCAACFGQGDPAVTPQLNLGERRGGDGLGPAGRVASGRGDEAVPAPPALTEASPQAAFFEKWWAAQTNVQTWSADFVQTRSLKVLAQPLVSTGHVWVAVPDRFRWELQWPSQTIALRQPDQLFIIYPKLKRAEKYPLGGMPAAGPLKDAMALLDASFPRDRATMEARFKLVSAGLTNSILELVLQPKSSSARKFVSQIMVGFHTNDFSMAATELTFADGSSLRNTFTNAVLNQPVEPGRFEPGLTPDYTVTEPMRQ